MPALQVPLQATGGGQGLYPGAIGSEDAVMCRRHRVVRSEIRTWAEAGAPSGLTRQGCLVTSGLCRKLEAADPRNELLGPLQLLCPQ